MCCNLKARRNIKKKNKSSNHQPFLTSKISFVTHTPLSSGFLLLCSQHSVPHTASDIWNSWDTSAQKIKHFKESQSGLGKGKPSCSQSQVRQCTASECVVPTVNKLMNAGNWTKISGRFWPMMTQLSQWCMDRYIISAYLMRWQLCKCLQIGFCFHLVLLIFHIQGKGDEITF